MSRCLYAGQPLGRREEISWVLTSYIVSVAITMPLSGWLAGRVGIKYFFLYSVIGFAVASALCGAATSLPELVLFRVLQVSAARAGAAGSGDTAVDQPAGAARPAMAVFGSGTILGPIAGPALGGWLTDTSAGARCFTSMCRSGLFRRSASRSSLETTAGSSRSFDFLGFASLGLAVAPAIDAGPRPDPRLVRLAGDLDRGCTRGDRLLGPCHPHPDRHRARF